jgi:hypothetical protein
MVEKVIVTENSSQGWNAYSQRFDYVPDPMTIRTAELFLKGKSGCIHDGLDTEDVWKAIDYNLHSLLTFFIILMTRDAIPLIRYRTTFGWSKTPGIEALLSDLVVDVDIEQEAYGQIKAASLDKLAKLNIENVAEKDVEDVNGELAAFAYEWQEDLGLGLPTPTRTVTSQEIVDIEEKRANVARFVVGGLMFGWYAEAANADHLMQAKRGRIFAALTRPDQQEGWVAYNKEDQLFADLKRVSLPELGVRVDEIPAVPNVLPYILLGRGDMDPKNPLRTREILEQALKLRQEEVGKECRKWFKNMREKLSLGQAPANALEDIGKLREEIEYRLQRGFPQWKWSVPISFKVALGPQFAAGIGAWKVEAGLGEIAVTVGEARVGIPNWIRNWLLDLVPLGQHRKLLLRSALAQAEYPEILKTLKICWEHS